MQDDDSPSFIKSAPIGKDLLEGQAQEQIAESLAELIRHDRTGSGADGKMESKLFGLDGSWGSGKSNLIKILETKLPDTHFFIYDAWGHQEDLQRRAFLEELTLDLCAQKIAGRNLRKKLKNLLSRKRETTTKTIPHISTGVIITILFAISIWITSTIAEVVDDPLWKLGVAFAPLFIGLGALFIASLIKWKFPPAPISEMYAFYKDKELSNETHVTISEKEPSVREFKKWMKSLSKALVKNGKELVIVFDNMDRLPTEKVRDLWSSIHTFFAETLFDGIWVIGCTSDLLDFPSSGRL